MKSYFWHIGDYARRTLALSLQQHGVYRLLLDAYYANESPLPGDLDECCELIGARSESERGDVAYILRRYFKHAEGLHHHDRADETIAGFLERAPAREQRRANQRARRERHNMQRALLFAGLQAAGARPEFQTGTPQLRDLARRMGLTELLAQVGSLDNELQSIPTAKGTRPDTHPDALQQASDAEGVPTPNEAHPDTRPDAMPTVSPKNPTEGAITHNPYIQSATSADASGRHRDAASREGQQARAQQVAERLQSLGLRPVIPTDPRFLALLEAGAAVGEFEAAAMQAVAIGKGWAYMLGTVSGRRGDAARIAQEATNPAQEAARKDWERALLGQTPKTQGSPDEH